MKIDQSIRPVGQINTVSKTVNHENKIKYRFIRSALK